MHKVCRDIAHVAIDKVSNKRSEIQYVFLAFFDAKNTKNREITMSCGFFNKNQKTKTGPEAGCHDAAYGGATVGT